eukprot:jgi/Undpi1/7836/HiC_scaffold_23.g10309.m1
MLGHLCVLHTRFKFCSGQELPLAATGLFDMFTIVLAGKNKPTASRLQRLLGARKHMVRDFIKYMQDKDISLVNGFCLAGKASVSETSLDRYPSDGSVLQDLLDAVFNPQDPSNLRGRSSSSYTNERRESEVMDEDEVSSDMESAGGSDSENDAVFNCLLMVGAADGDGGALGEVQAYIGLDRGAISAYIARPSVSLDVLRQARYIALSGRPAVDCMERGSPAIVSLPPTFGYVSDDKPCHYQAQAVHAEGGAGNEDDGGPLEPWHIFVHRQDVRGGSAVMPALQELVARPAYLAFIPHRGRGDWVLLVRLITATELHERFFNASSGTRSVFGRWAASVNDAIEEEDHASVVGDLLPFLSPPAENDHEYIIHDYNVRHHIAAPRPAVNPLCASILQWPRNMVEECTLFVFWAEHRDSVHGPPRHSTAMSTAFHGQPRTLHGLSRTFDGFPRTFHGLPRNAAASSATPWRPVALAVAISTAIITEKSTAISTARSTAISTAISIAAPAAYHGKPRSPTETSTEAPTTTPTNTSMDRSTETHTDLFAETSTDIHG